MYWKITPVILLIPLAQCGSSGSDELRMQYSSPGTVGTSIGAFVNALPIGMESINVNSAIRVYWTCVNMQ